MVVGHQLALEEEEEEEVVVVVDRLLTSGVAEAVVAEEYHCHSSSEVVEVAQLDQD